MIDIKKNFSLKNYNSLQIDCISELFIEVKTPEEALSAVTHAKDNNLNFIVVGGGTNIVFSKQNFKGLVIKNSIKGKKIIADIVILSSGESWHDCVLWTLKNNLYGLENLSLIPGTVGAAPVQNIGAYGKDISEFIEYVKVINLKTLEVELLSNSQCEFKYRSSLFKQEVNYMIVEVALKLSYDKSVHTHYKSLSDYMIKKGMDILNSTPEEVSSCVCEIRKNILPDPRIIPNVGSFFKNITLDDKAFKELQNILPTPFNLDENNNFKVSSAFLIDSAGWKGRIKGEVSVSSKHSLVINTSGIATGNEVIVFANAIIEDIKSKFNVVLEIEPSVI